MVALIGFGFWDLVRTDEIRGDFTSSRSWRWQPTSEDLFLESLASSEVESDDFGSADWLDDPEWPAFRGADRRGVQPGIVLGEDWAAQSPRELWRIRVGPGWGRSALSSRAGSTRFRTA